MLLLLGSLNQSKVYPGKKRGLLLDAVRLKGLPSFTLMEVPLHFLVSGTPDLGGLGKKCSYQLTFVLLKS